MKFESYLNEEYIGSFTASGFVGLIDEGYTEVFKNPSPKEIREVSEQYKDLKGHLRFFIDLKNKNLFIFKANVFHDEVLDYLHSKNLAGSGLYRGDAKVDGNKLKLTSFAVSRSTFKNMKSKWDDGWTTKYFIKPILDTVRELLRLNEGNVIDIKGKLAQKFAKNLVKNVSVGFDMQNRAEAEATAELEKLKKSLKYAY